jgi:hypothetical protein
VVPVARESGSAPAPVADPAGDAPGAVVSDVDDKGACADPACLAGAAALVKADLAMTALHSALGNADVVTLLVWEVAGRNLVRDAVSAKERGELPERLAPVVDDLVKRAARTLPALRRPEIAQKLEAQRVDVCTDGNGWWFCDARKAPTTENEMVRRYQRETQRHDLDDALVDRVIDLEPWIWLGAGAGTGLASLILVLAVVGTPEGQRLARDTEDAWIVAPALGASAALGILVYGAILLSDGPHVDDGSEHDHLLDQASARVVAQRYNAAVLQRLEREVTAAP